MHSKNAKQAKRIEMKLSPKSKILAAMVSSAHIPEVVSIIDHINEVVIGRRYIAAQVSCVAASPLRFCMVRLYATDKTVVIYIDSGSDGRFKSGDSK